MFSGPSNDDVGLKETKKTQLDNSPIEEQPTTFDIVLENTLCDSFNREGIETCVIDLEESKRNKDFSFSNPAFKSEPTTDCEEGVVVASGNIPGWEASGKATVQPREENAFSFSNPAFIREDNQRNGCEKSQEKDAVEGDPSDENLMEERLSNRSDSSGYSEGYASSPETDSVYSTDGSVTENKPQVEQDNCVKNEISSQVITTVLSPCESRENSLNERTETICSEVSVVIEERRKCNMKKIKAKKTWTGWFKTPMFYKVFRFPFPVPYVL